MAFTITKNLTTKGIPLSSFYVRLSVTNRTEGDRISYMATWYASKEAYEASPRNSLKIDKLPTGEFIPLVWDFDYNRATDGVDTLDFAHDKFKEALLEMGEGTEAIFVEADFVKDI